MTLKEIESIEYRLIDALKEGNLTFLDSIMHPNLVGVAPNGDIFNKKIDLESHRKGDMIIENITPKIDTIKIFGDTAIVVITYDTRGIMLGKPVSGLFRYNRIWKKVENKLQIISVSCVKWMY
ncbi:MAG: nuclear transport factor 2 family protein [Bacteroidales bacterium]|nr:nuclear transport factor 2 family protein [Bacteroidales bacterium]